MEANEISEFTEQVREGGETNLKSVSLAISVLAVLVAMVTVMGHRTHTEAVLQQAKASDAWNEYQARKMRVQQDLSAITVLGASGSSEYTQSNTERMKAEIEKWNGENESVLEKAKEHEHEVESAEKKAFRYDIGEALLQISVVLASITLLTRRYHYVIAAILLGLIGLLTAASAFLIH